MNQAAAASLVGILLVAIGGSVTALVHGSGEIAVAQAKLAADQGLVAHDRALLTQRRAIQEAYMTSQRLHPMNDRREILFGIQQFPGVKLRGFSVGNNDNHFKVDISGPYTRLISVSVGFPATVPGVTIEQIQISVDDSAGADADNAAAEITGTLS